LSLNYFSKEMGNSRSIYAFDSYRVDVANRLLLRQDEPISLTPKAVEILIALIAHRGQIISKTDLMKIVWPDTIVEDGNLSQNIYLLRRKLTTAPNGRAYIETVARRGYRFNGEVQELTQGNGHTVLTANEEANRAQHSAALNKTADRRALTTSDSLSQPRSHYLVFAIGAILLLGVTSLLINYARTRASRATNTLPEYEQDYLKGRQFWKKQTTEALEESIECFNESIRRDGTYAPAYAGLADAYIALSERYDMGRHDSEALNNARNAANRALEFNPKLAEAHVSLAVLKQQLEWDWKTAENEFKEAIKLNQNYAYAHERYAFLLAALGKHEEAKAEMQRAIALDSPSVAVREDFGEILLFGGDYKGATAQFQSALALDSSDPLASSLHRWLGLAYEERARHEQAVAEFIESLRLQNGSPERISALRKAYDAEGIRGYWSKWLEYQDQRIKLNGINPFKVAQVYALVGDLDGAFAQLEHARDDHSLPVAALRFGPVLQNVRLDHRYTRLLKTINIQY
jgi:DNA-binding winged helix-turn-helix (wHTH) protein/Tfp pilus assembly protein PilF